MKKYRHLRGTLFDIERELRSRNSGADENFSESKTILRANTREALTSIGEEPRKDKEELKKEIQGISAEAPTGKHTQIADILDTGAYDQWKERCMTDVKNRLESRVEQIRKESNRTEIVIPKDWFSRDFGFQQWMADGEMPNSYGFGLKVLEYYFSLSAEDKEEFNDASKGYRTAGAITWALDRFQSEEKGFLSETQQKRVNLLNEVKKSENTVVLGNEAGNNFKNAIKEGEEGIKNFLLDQKNRLVDFYRTKSRSVWSISEKSNDVVELIAGYRRLGHAMRKEIDNALKSGVEAMENWKKFALALKDDLIELDKKYHLGFGDNEGSTHHKDLFRLTYGEIGRAWGDITAAKGLHPWTLQEIKKSHSVLGEDYKKLGKEKIQGIIDEATNSWCDMNAPGGLWSLSANLDRYRNTIVILHIPEGQEKTGNLSKKSGGLMAATFLELQMSYYTPIIDEGKLLQKYARMLSTDFVRSSNSVYIGTYPEAAETEGRD